MGNRLNERSLALVFDYIPEIDRIEEVAEKNFLLRRFAIALDSYRPFSQCMYFDHDLLQMILIKVLPQFEYDDICVSYNGHKTRVPSIDCLPRFYDVGEQDSFEDISLYKNEKMVVYIFRGGYTELAARILITIHLIFRFLAPNMIRQQPPKL